MLQGDSHVPRGPILLFTVYSPCHVSLNVRIKVKRKTHIITPRIVSLGRLCSNRFQCGRWEIHPLESSRPDYVVISPYFSRTFRLQENAPGRVHVVKASDLASQADFVRLDTCSSTRKGEGTREKPKRLHPVQRCQKSICLQCRNRGHGSQRLNSPTSKQQLENERELVKLTQPGTT